MSRSCAGPWVVVNAITARFGSTTAPSFSAEFDAIEAEHSGKIERRLDRCHDHRGQTADE